MHRRTRTAWWPAACVVVATGAALAAVVACSAPLRPATEADRTTPPRLGRCYQLAPQAAEQPSSEAEPVPCTSTHTAQTFAIGTLPKSTGGEYSDSRHGAWLYPRCAQAFAKFLSADESLVLRTQLSWVWFRPSPSAWDDGARWYRCDAVGGSADSDRYRALPTTVRGLFRARPPQEWLTCVRGATVSGSAKVPCSESHDWRAVTTIKLGEPEDPWPGERLVQVRTHDFCSDSVGAWMNYPVDYEFGYTSFHEAEWKAGNRRSICWARTEK